MALGQREHELARLPEGRDLAAVLEFDRLGEFSRPAHGGVSIATGVLNQPLALQRAQTAARASSLALGATEARVSGLFRVLPMALGLLHGRQAGDQLARIAESGERPPVNQLDRFPE